MSSNRPPSGPKLIFLVAEDWYFWSHRLPVARAALQHGYDVAVATRAVNYGQRIQDEGFRLIPLRMVRESYSPFNEFRTIRQVRQVYKAENPDIVHHVGIKPILYGSIAALGQSNLHVVNAFAGLGYLGASSTLKARVLRSGIFFAFRCLLNRPNYRVLLQNQEDRQLMIDGLGVSPDKLTVIRGSGVDLSRFQPTDEPDGIPIVLLGSRMLWIKGIGEFVEAADLLRKRGVKARFVLAGDTDVSNPSCVPRAQLLEWQSSGAVEWWGHQDDMPKVFQQASLVVLPSHGGEGVPKALLEAAASARAIVTTDVPGCRDIVRRGINGILTPPGEPAALADAIEQLLQDPGRRHQMAARSREIAANDFSQEAVISQTMEMYRRLLSSYSPQPQLVKASGGTSGRI
jgi:glycosyltransferase involved in cell wall biosynthesis